MRGSWDGSRRAQRAIPPWSFTPAGTEAALVNLLVDLNDARFSQHNVHHALEALDNAGIVPLREHRTPERLLGWIDGEFGGTWSSEAAASGTWIAERLGRPVGFAAYDARGLDFRWLRPWRAKASVGLFGPMGIAQAERGAGVGAALLHAALFSLRERGYAQALIPGVRCANGVDFYERQAAARIVETFEPRASRRWRATVLASGNGSNFQAVADAAASGALPFEIAALVTNRPEAYATYRAYNAGIASRVVHWQRGTEPRASYDWRLHEAVAATEPDLVILLGWMHVLPPSFLERFSQTINLHPAFLPLDPAADEVTMPDGNVIPAYRGAHAFADALAAGSRWAGASVHRVGPVVDRGTILARAPLEIRGKVEDELLTRLHALERQVLHVALQRWSWEQA